MDRRFGTTRAAARLMRVGSLLAGTGLLRKALHGTVVKPARVLRAPSELRRCFSRAAATPR